MGRRTLITLALLATWAGQAEAHPHVWTDMRSTLMVDAQGMITGVSVAWTFDDGYSGFALEGLDTNNDGVFSPDEIKPLTEENIKSLSESDYFVFMRQSGKLLPQGQVSNYAQTYNDARLTLFFDVPLATPVDPRAGEFDYKVYDPDFFIAFDYVKDDPTDMEGELPQGCSRELKPVLTDEELMAKRDFLASKDASWQNDTGEDFGSIFAQPVVVTCGS
jgi:ABC-type uncharacterized transport system substrate-binding protein